MKFILRFVLSAHLVAAESDKSCSVDDVAADNSIVSLLQAKFTLSKSEEPSSEVKNLDLQTALATEFVSTTTHDIIKCSTKGDAAKGTVKFTYETGDDAGYYAGFYDDVSGTYSEGGIIKYGTGADAFSGQVLVVNNATVIRWSSKSEDVWYALERPPSQSTLIKLTLWVALGSLVIILTVSLHGGSLHSLRKKLQTSWKLDKTHDRLEAEDMGDGFPNGQHETSWETYAGSEGFSDAELKSLQNGEQIPEAAVPGGLIDLFEAQARRHPDDTALLEAESGTALTYSELAKSVDSLAGALKEQFGIGKGDVVGLLLQPSRCAVVATLAVMKTGAAWLPLDTKSPGPRLQKLLHRAGTRVALAQDEHTMTSMAGLFPTCLLSKSGALPPDPSVKALQTTRSIPLDIAAIFYTSGSSGEPKAVMYGHDTLCHGALTFGKLCQADKSSIFLIKTPIIWAVIEYEVFTPLIFGAKAVLSADSQRDVVTLTRTISNAQVSILVTSAPVLQMLVGESLPSLRHAVNVGAALPVEICKSVQQAFGTSLSLHNLYGCTESPCLQWTYDSAAVVPGQKLAYAGLPQPGAAVHILDDKLTPVTPGRPGEIFIGGPYVSRGYLGDEYLTNERFISKPGIGRLYRTGDVGRWVHDALGNPVLQVEGRTDRQLNIKGVRVSPEEIEAVLLRVPGVKEVAVVASQGANQSIVAGIVGIGVELEAFVEKHAKEHLPTHMRPALLLWLDNLPKLGNGKIDLVSMTKLAGAKLAAKVNNQEEADVEAMDSLGFMRKVKREAALEIQVISAWRGLAAVGIVMFHYWACKFDLWCNHEVSQNKLLWASQGPSYFRELMTGFVRINFELPIFIMTSGYLDSQQAPKTKWRENLMMFLLNILWVEAMKLSFTVADGPRWYLFYYIVCNLLHTWLFMPLRELVPQRYLVGVTIAIILLVCRVSTLLHHINFCGAGPAVQQLLYYLIPEAKDCKLVPRTSPHTIFFGLIQTGLNSTWLFPLYAVTWWCGPYLVRQIRKQFEKLTWRPPWLLVATVLMFMVFLTGKVPNGSRLVSAGPLWQLYGLVFALLIVLTIALASTSVWFPKSSLEYLGRCSFGTYIIHYTVPPWKFGVPDLVTILPSFGGWPGDGLLKFLICFLYCALYAATVGCAFQCCLIDGPIYLFSKISKAISLASTCLYRADSKQQTQAVKQAHERWHQACTSCFDLGGVLCIDGGTGSEVQREAEKLGHDEAVHSEGWSCVQWKTHPDVLMGVHTSYLHAGAKLVIANSYATNRHIMKAAGYEELTCKATLASVDLARKARDGLAPESRTESAVPNLVAGSMSCHPPGMAHGANMDMGKWPAPEVENENYLEQAQLLRDGGADVIFVEMVWEWKVHGSKAVRAAASCGLPVVVCLSVFNEKSCKEDMPQLHDGTLVAEVARELASASEDGLTNVVGICIHHTKLSLVLPCLMAMRHGGWEGIIGAYPDHGTFEMPHWRFEPLEAAKIVDYVSEWVAKANCQMVGGCCGIGPETIKLMSAWCETFNASKGIAANQLLHQCHRMCPCLNCGVRGP